MAERDATVAKGPQPRPVAPRKAGQTPSDQVEHETGTTAENAGGDAGPAAPGDTAPDPAAASADHPEAAGNGTDGPAGADRADAASPEDPMPSVTGTADAGGASGAPAEGPGTAPETPSGDPGAGSPEPSAEAADGDAESPSEGDGEAPGEASEAAADENAPASDDGPADEGARSTSTELVRVAPPGELVRVPDAAFPTEKSLAAQDEATTQLRRAIDELRQLLDVDAVITPPARRRRRRWPVAVAILAGLAVVGLLAAALVTGDRSDRPAARPTTRATAGATGGATGAPNDLPAPRTPPAGSVPATGPGVTAPGTLLVVGLTPDGALRVTEQAVLPAPAARRLPLAPADVSRLGGEIAQLRPQVTDLRAALDGVPAPVLPAGAASWSVPVTGDPARVSVSYTVRGAVIRTPATGDTARVLALVSPLLGRDLVTRGLPLVVRTSGIRAIGATCPDAPAALSLCGTGDRGDWTANVPRSLDPVVVVQADVPA